MQSSCGKIVEHILIQKMVTGFVGEVLVGYQVDHQVGPVVVLAAGGVTTEIYKDRTIRLAPVDFETALEMITEVKGFALLKGFRGRKPGDVEALARLIVSVSSLAVDPLVVELEINPVLVMGEGNGVLAVDVLASVAEHD